MEDCVEGGIECRMENGRKRRIENRMKNGMENEMENGGWKVKSEVKEEYRGWGWKRR